MVEVLIEEMSGSDRSRPKDYETSRGRRQQNEQDHSSEEYAENPAKKRFDRADIVRDVRLRR